MPTRAQSAVAIGTEFPSADESGIPFCFDPEWLPKSERYFHIRCAVKHISPKKFVHPMFREACLPEHWVPPPRPRNSLPASPPESLSPPAPATPKNHSSLRVNLVCPKWDMIRCLLTFDDLDGLFGVSGLGFDADEHEAILDSAFVESLSRFPGFRNIPTIGALHFPPEHDRAGIPLRATPRKAETALKSSQTVEVGIAELAASQPLDQKRGRTMWFMRFASFCEVR